MKILFLSFIVLGIVTFLIIIKFSIWGEQFRPVPNRPDYQNNLITETGVLGYQIRNGNEVIYLTSDHKIINVYSYNSENNNLLKLNSSNIPIEITVNNNLLGFASARTDLVGNIFFDFGNLIRISPNNEVTIYRKFNMEADQLVLESNETQNQLEIIKLENTQKSELPKTDSKLTLLKSDNIYTINKSRNAQLLYLCYFKISLGDDPSCRGNRLLLRIGTKELALPNFIEIKEDSKYDSPFIYVPYDSNFFTKNGTFIFLSQSNKLYQFK